MIMKLLLALLVAYAGWRLWKHGFGRKVTGASKIAPNPQDIETARRTLGVDQGAGEAEIRAAHRRLIALAHPDRGGSAEEARALNAARDLLIDRAA